MSTLRIKNISIDYSKSIVRDGFYAFLGKMNPNEIKSELMPLMQDHHNKLVTIIFNNERIDVYAGGSFFDKFGNIEIAFIEKRIKEKAPVSANEPITITDKTISYQNILNLVMQQDKVIRKIINELPALLNDSDIRNYNDSYPLPVDIKHEVPNLHEWIKSVNGIDFLKGLPSYV
ncbi:hypothetical protein [Lactiplantibacillus plantarum]|uniref:hypothetical protein n=1 Tax=Lactiplantibacillus plantarum TaxID=1590 RepID=UPI0013D6E112|nr:hypothetical protein [Lactiplantibacillus plantarum]MCW6116583.1 hypothetical protein [Lactiplantibacillus plantarum]